MHAKSSSNLFANVIALCGLIGLAGIGAPAAAAPATIPVPAAGFQLPPAPTPSVTATPQVQGPVDIDGPVPVAPRAIPTARPAPAAPATQRPLPTILAPDPRPAQSPATRRFTPAARAAPGQRITGEDIISADELSAASIDLTPANPVLQKPGSAASLPSMAESTADPVARRGAENRGLSANWSLWLALVGLLAALLAAIYLLRSRRRVTLAGTPLLEPGLVRPSDRAPPPVPTPAPKRPLASAPIGPGIPVAAPTTRPISLEIAPIKLSRSMMNATLSCAIKVHNLTGKNISFLHLAGDLVTAHGKVPMSEQWADNATVLASLDTIPELAAGETTEIAANLALPISQIRQISQGRAILYVPLLRLRVTSGGLDPVTQTFVIGMKPPGSDKVQPFRLDEMPQTYRQIGSRALALAASDQDSERALD